MAGFISHTTTSGCPTDPSSSTAPTTSSSNRSALSNRSGTRHRKAPIDAVAIPTCAVEQRQDWLRCESRVNIHLVLAFELLGFKAVPIDGTFENNELALSVLSQMCSEEDKSNGVEDASHCRDLAPPLDKVEAKGVATNRPSPLALLTISRTSARLKCYGISLNKVFHHIGKAFKPDEQSTVMNFQKSVSHILEVFDTNVSLEASIAFSPLDIQLDLFQVTFGDCVKLGVVSKPESKIDSEVGNKGNTTHTLEAELKLTMGSVMGFIRNILLDQPSIADTLEVITQTKFLTLTETSLFHIIIKLDLGGGKGMVMEHFSLFVGPITLLGVPLNITTNLPTSSDQVNPRRSLSLALQKPILPLGEETTLLSIVSKLHALPPKIQDVLQKFVLKDYKLLLSLPVDSGGLSTLLELSFAFYINVSLRSRNAISCQACLLHNPLQTCVVVLFDNLELFTIISAIFGTSFGLPLRLYICQFLLLHQSTSATVPCSTPESFVTSFFSENEERQFQNMSGQQLALKQEERILLQKSCQKLLKRKEDTFLCLTISCYLTGQLFDMLHLEGTTLVGKLMILDESPQLKISLPELKLPGLDPGKASLLLSPGGVEIKTTLKFSHNLKLEASLKGSITSRSVRGRVTLDEDEKGEKPGIPLSLFIPGSLPFIKNLAVYGLQGEVGVSFPPLNVSILLGGGIRVLWEDGPKPFMEAVVRATVLVCAPPAISITTLYVACADITLGSLIRIVTGWSYKDVQLLDTIFPVVKELAFLCKVDDKELETVPSMPNTESAKQNSLVHVIQMFSERKKGSPLLLAHEQCLAFVAHLSWLGLEGKVVFFSKVGSTGAALLFQLMIENWECKVGSIVLFKLGHGSSGKGLDIKLLLDTKSRQASFDLEAYIEVLPGILGFTIQAEVHFGNGGRPGSVTSSGKKQDNGLHLEIAVKISFSRRENCEDNDMSPGNPSGLVLEGTLQVTWRKIVPDVRAAIRMSSRDGVISALVDGLKYCLTNFFNVCKGALQRAEDAVSKYVPRFVQGLLKGVLYVAKAVVNVVEQGFVAAILKLLNACAKVLDVKSLEVCGEVCGDDKSVVVMVKFELIVFGHVLQGSIQVNLKTLIIDLCKKVLQNIVLWWKDKNASEPVEKSEVPDDDWYRKECFFSDEDEELNVTSTTCEDAAYKTVALPPCSEYIGSPDDDESTIQLNSLINDVSRKVDLSSSMPPEDALDLTTASLSDPMLSEVPCITKPPIKCSLCSELVPTCIFSKHMRICRLTESPCLKCGEKVRLANKERHDTVDCPKKVLIPRHCEYCSEKVADGSKMHEHYSQFCEGDWTCPKCEKPMRRKAIVMHFLTSDVSVKCSNGGPDDICSKCNCYKESPHDCSVDKFCPYCEENQSTTNHICGAAEECAFCHILFPRDLGEDHKERDCTGEVSCSYCGELLPASKEPARVKRSQHFAACKDAPAVCFYCTQLFHRSVISKHMENCKDRFKKCTARGCTKKIESEVYNSAYDYGQCPCCLEHFTSHWELREHLKHSCAKFCLQCRCGAKFLRTHMTGHLKSCATFEVSCGVCNLTNLSLRALCKHLSSTSCALPLPCPLCRGPACFSEPDITSHLWKCTAETKCPFCPTSTLLCDRANHLQFECELFEVFCFFCQRRMPMRKLYNHLHCCPCIKRYCIFDTCTAARMTLTELEIHLDTRCPYFFVSCMECNAPILKKDEEAHLIQHRILRVQKLPPDSFLTSTTHGNNLQRLLPIEKKFLISKGKTATRRQNRLHKIALVNFLSEEMLQQDEGINLVQCPKCSETMGYSDLPVHLSCYCPRNLEKCPRQCGYTGPASNIIQHLTKQCYLSPGRCIRGDKCTLQVHFRVPPEEARLLYPDEPGTEIHKPGIFQYVVERIIPENSRRLSGIDPEEALYTTLCSRSVENGAPSCIHKRDETRHAIFCFNGIQECIFCHCPTSDLSQHILDCTEARRPIECDFCSVRVPVVEMPEHWLYSCGGKNFLVTCQDCGARVPFRSLEAHHLCSCPKSSLQCHLCGKHFNTEKYPRHMLKKCNGSLFTVKCGLCSQCCTTGELLNGTHYATKCSNCSWRCPLGAADEIETNACRKEVPLCKLEKHLIPDIGGDLCKSCKLPCPKYPACKAMVLRRDLTHHMEHECDYYTIPCPGCKGLIPKKNYALHERGCVFANEIEKECGDCHQIVKTASWNYHRAKTCEKRLVMAHSELDFQRHEPLQQEHIMRPLSGPHREQKESGLFSWFRSLLFGKASTTSTKKHCSLCNQDFSDQKATCPKVEALRCKTCGETDKTANGGPTVTKPCLRACSHCRAPEPQWKTTKCTHVVCKRCAEVVTVGGKGCLQQTFDQVRWEVREKGYFMNL